MGTVLAVLGVLAVLFVAALVATRDGELLVDAPRDRADPALPADRPVAATDLERVRFGMALRGYRMAEVDALLDRLAAQLRARDEALPADEAGEPRAAHDEPQPDGDAPGSHATDTHDDPLPPVRERPGAQPPGPVPFPEPVHVDEPEALPPPVDEPAPDEQVAARPGSRRS